ncbi:glycosyltransferase family 25 protein [Pedobacter psychroterrae]|uniref:Glycosyl transferase family 25 n=1 Tax=Pedobacter psychroterrae TaxID=2530453 RepID=A0A4V2ML96_9SPHI|nr:hypothetical protein [Pedobacter psychroterrae]TCD01257.1 hypothetical protein EZ437_10910 [Pedobacter psychroterrae]
MQKALRTFVVNLKTRTDRREHILREFSDKPEFDVTLVDAITSSRGGLGLWLTFKHIVRSYVSQNDEFILICEDDHIFTAEYSHNLLQNCIIKAQEFKADILLGGVSWVSSINCVQDHVFWVEEFSGTQFMIVFKQFYSVLRDAKMNSEGAADWKVGSLTQKKMIIFPFISTQKEFGYSDTTVNNRIPGRVSNFFDATQNRLRLLTKVVTHFQKLESSRPAIRFGVFQKISVPTYIINLPHRVDRLNHIMSEFADKPEFILNLVVAIQHKVGAYGLWQTIRQIVEKAKQEKEEMIVICEDDHYFTEFYNKEFFFKNVLEADFDKAAFLSGGTGKFDYAIPVSKNRYWVSHCLSAQFLVIYSRFFDAILNVEYDETIIADMTYSKITTNKIILFPFVSGQKDFGYSDVTDFHNTKAGVVQNMFNEATNRFLNIHAVNLLKYEN